jgi:hypothetical protein
MYDLTILEAIKIKIQLLFKINSRAYIFKKYKIDSIQYAKSNIYYASDYNGIRACLSKLVSD